MKYELGRRIRYFRELRGLSQKQLAARIGVSNSRLSNWEQGLNRPDADTLRVLCTVLQVSANELLDIQQPNSSYSEEEERLIRQYREKPELQQAVRILLDLDNQNETPAR